MSLWVYFYKDAVGTRLNDQTSMPIYQGEEFLLEEFARRGTEDGRPRVILNTVEGRVRVDGHIDYIIVDDRWRGQHDRDCDFHAAAERLDYL